MIDGTYSYDFTLDGISYPPLVESLPALLLAAEHRLARLLSCLCDCRRSTTLDTCCAPIRYELGPGNPWSRSITRVLSRGHPCPGLLDRLTSEAESSNAVPNWGSRRDWHT